MPPSRFALRRASRSSRDNRASGGGKEVEMRRVLLTAMVAAVVIPFAARAQGKPDFSGTWTMDTAKSDPAPQGRGGGGGGGGPVTIKQTATELSVTSEGR